MGKRFIKLRKQYKKENLEAKHFIAQFKQKQDLTNKLITSFKDDNSNLEKKVKVEVFEKNK